jgi:hypothetical protein
MFTFFIKKNIIDPSIIKALLIRQIDMMFDDLRIATLQLKIINDSSMTNKKYVSKLVEI